MHFIPRAAHRNDFWSQAWLLLVICLCCPTAAVCSAEVKETDQVVVLFNKNVPESKRVAEHYRSKRGIPADQLIGLNLPNREQITRTEYRSQIEQPLLQLFLKKDFFTLGKGGDVAKVIQGKIRYVVLCYGVPLKISHDPEALDRGTESLQPELRRTEAAVDSELALLPSVPARYTLTGPLINKVFNTTNTGDLHPTNGILLVARLDGPTPEIAMSLVDKSLEAERDGLWGNAYFDLRGLKTNDPVRLGDDWIRRGSQLARQRGYETIVDEQPDTFPSSFPMSHIAIYAGWYTESLSGIFAVTNQMEFMPGAFAYHLHSHNAFSLRTPDKHWAGPLLVRGATCLMGSVEEPYLGGTPDLGVFFHRFLVADFTFGEAAYTSQQAISWQTTVVGDPLYRSAKIKNRDRHEDLTSRQSKKIEWSHLAIMNLNQLGNYPAADSIAYLEAEPTTAKSAILQEKLGELYLAIPDDAKTGEHWEKALKLSVSPGQKLRMHLKLLDLTMGSTNKAIPRKWVDSLEKNFPNYPKLDFIKSALQESK